jgi:ribosomal protein S24E
MLVDMEFEILEEKENVFLKRREIKLNIKHPNLPTPKKEDLVKEISSKYSVPGEKIAIDYIFTKKGVPESLAKVKIYQEAPKKVEVRKDETQTS